jgi:hypothetical protein
VTPERFLILNLCLAFYNVGTIWAHEVDIFRTWRLIDARDFHRVQAAHWRKLPYWIFAPVGLWLCATIALIAWAPAPLGWLSLLAQLASHVLTATTWGRWQAKLSRDPLGPESPHLRRILATHWLRTALITLAALLMLAWAIGA